MMVPWVGLRFVKMVRHFVWVFTDSTTGFSTTIFIYSRPIAGIRAEMGHETTYLQTSKWHVKNIFMHLGFKYHTDQCAQYWRNPQINLF